QPINKVLTKKERHVINTILERKYVRRIGIIAKDSYIAFVVKSRAIKLAVKITSKIAVTSIPNKEISSISIFDRSAIFLPCVTSNVNINSWLNKIVHRIRKRRN